MPERIQLKRTKGWKMPANSVKVDRSTKWGNPFVVHSDRGPDGKRFPMDAKLSVLAFRSMLKKEGAWWSAPLPWPKGKIPAGPPTTIGDIRAELRGKNLACWCKIGEPCHADVLLELANAQGEAGKEAPPVEE